MGALIRIIPLFVALGRIPFNLFNDGPALSKALSKQVERFPLLNLLPDLITIQVILSVYFLLARALDRRPFKDYGLHINRSWWRDLGFGLFAGAAPQI